MSVAHDWPARLMPNGVTWYRPQIRDASETWGWTSLKENAHLSYFEPDAPAPRVVACDDVDPLGNWPTNEQLDAAQPADLAAMKCCGGVVGHTWECPTQAARRGLTVTDDTILDDPGPLIAHNKALIEHMRSEPQPREDPPMAKADQFDEPDDAPRFTTYSRYPLPPAPPRFKVVYDGYGRYKLPSPTTGRPTAFSRSTTIADTLDETYNLNRWKRRQAVKAIFTALKELDEDDGDGFDTAGGTPTLRSLLQDAMEAMEAEDDRKLDAAIDMLDNLTGGRDAAELGEAVHAWLEAVDIGTVLPANVPDQFQPYVAAYRDALRRAGLVALSQYVERVVLNDRGEETIVGTIDRIFLVVATGELVMGDVKTSKTLEYSWLTYSVQVGGVYGYSTMMMNAEGDTSVGKHGWEPMPEINQEYAIILHVPSDQPERSAAVTIDMWFGGETMVTSLEVRRRRKDSKKAVPFVHEIPVPTVDALKYVEARDAVLDVSDAGQLADVWERYQAWWTDDLTALGEHVAELLSAQVDAPASA